MSGELKADYVFVVSIQAFLLLFDVPPPPLLPWRGAAVAASSPLTPFDSN